MCCAPFWWSLHSNPGRRETTNTGKKIILCATWQHNSFYIEIHLPQVTTHLNACRGQERNQNKSGWLEKAALFNYSEIVSKKINV